MNEATCEPIRLAISTCPNDTFAFHAILNERIDLQGLKFDIQLLDISELNSGLFAGKFDVAKCSFHAALRLANEYVVLPSGAALGFGNGPLLLAANANNWPERESQLTLCPGPNTTATLLYKMFHNGTAIKHDIFSGIMPALMQGKADFGVCIHEGRFTYQESGLHLVEDLGARWERETDCPLPLGGIVARESLPGTVLQKVQSTIQSSIVYGLKNREETLPTMRSYSQEFNDDVLMQHVDLYVNDWTVDLGAKGSETLKRFSALAAKYAGNAHQQMLRVL